MIDRIKKVRRGSRAKIWSVALLALVAVAGYFHLYPERLPAWAAKTSLGRDLQATTLYQWQDSSGAWQVSDQPPPAGVDFRVQSYSRDTNVLPLPPELRRD